MGLTFGHICQKKSVDPSATCFQAAPRPLSKAPHARTEQSGANQHLQPAGMSPVLMVVEEKKA